MKSDGNFYAEVSDVLFQSSLPLGSGSKSFELKITSLNGHLKTTIPVIQEKTLIKTNGWSNGTYICNLLIDGKVVRSEKMVLK
ncbi:MAG: hypothetical protein ABIJ97_07540 [Bacteroidota bacterium]